MSTEATNQDAGETLPEDGVVEDGAAAPEGETPEVEVELDDDGNPIEPAEDAEDFEEIEHDGEKYALPKALKPLLLMQADYTKKTQELADHRKSWEADVADRRKAFAEADEAEIQQRAKVVAISDQLSALDKAIATGAAEIQNVDYDALSKMENGHLELQRAQIQLQALKDAREKLTGEKTQIAGELDAKTKARALELQQATAKQIEDRDATMSRDIPNWKERRPQIEAFAIKAGVPEASLAATTDPLVFKMLDLALEGQASRDAKAKAASAAKRVQPAVTGAARPVPKVSGGATPRTDPNRMSTDEWMKHRTAQLAKKGGR